MKVFHDLFKQLDCCVNVVLRTEDNFPDIGLNKSCSVKMGFKSLPNDKILDWSKWKASTDDKINLKFVFVKGRKHCGKRKICWLPAFSPFPTMCLKRPLCLGVVKSWDCVVKS